MYSLLQISFKERFELYRNQLANWQCWSLDWFLFNTTFYWKKMFEYMYNNVFNPLCSITFVIFIKFNPAPILFQLQKQPLSI